MITFIGRWLSCLALPPDVITSESWSTGRQYENMMAVEMVCNFVFVAMRLVSLTALGLACTGVSEGLSHGGVWCFHGTTKNNTLSASHISANSFGTDLCIVPHVAMSDKPVQPSCYMPVALWCSSECITK